ncbi:MAG TPA: hypothetical protein VHE78_03515 [Gemmatimonadaceae bacterium]|nr:hypothetical protein [Gemmatimonadaceae bacterium]
MTNEDSRRIASVVRVSEFAKQWQLDTPPYGAVLKRLHAAAVRLPWLAMEQQDAHSQWQGDSHVLDLLRIDLRRKHLMKYGPMGKDAFKNVAGAEAVFTVPDARVSIPTLIEFADAMAKFIEKHMEEFLALEQPTDLVDRMRAATERLRVHHRSIEESIARQVAATAALAREVPEARKDIKILGGLLEDRLDEGGTFATQWHRAQRLGKRMGPPRGGKWKWRTRKEPPRRPPKAPPG